MGVEKGNPAIYVDIEAHQAEVRRAGAPLLWSLACAVRRTGMSAVERQVAEDFFDRIADEVLWAATEVYPNDDWKLLSQRYISMQVRERWMAAHARGARATKMFTRDSNNGDRVAVKHEHVVPRERLKQLVLAASSEQHVQALVGRSLGCIVTCEEASALPSLGEGWKRYIDRVRVFDRKTQRELDLQAEWERQQRSWSADG